MMMFDPSNPEHQRWAAELAACTIRVWCTYNARPARTADGFCEYCGSVKHEPLVETASAR